MGVDVGLGVRVNVGVGLGVTVSAGLGVSVGVDVSVGRTVRDGVAISRATFGAVVMTQRPTTVASASTMIRVSPSDRWFSARCISLVFLS